MAVYKPVNGKIVDVTGVPDRIINDLESKLKEQQQKQALEADLAKQGLSPITPAGTMPAPKPSATDEFMNKIYNMTPDEAEALKKSSDERFALSTKSLNEYDKEFTNNFNLTHGGPFDYNFAQPKLGELKPITATPAENYFRDLAEAKANDQTYQYLLSEQKSARQEANTNNYIYDANKSINKDRTVTSSLLNAIPNTLRDVFDLKGQGMEIKDDKGNTIVVPTVTNINTQLNKQTINEKIDNDFLRLGANFLYDVTSETTKIIGAAAANVVIPGSGTFLYNANIFADTYSDAKLQGYNDRDALLYGVAVTGINYGLEKILSPIAVKTFGGTGSEVSSAIANELVVKLNAKPGLANFVANAICEGGEEFFEEYAENIAATLILGEESGILSKELFLDALYSGAVGAVLGGISGEHVAFNYESMIGNINTEIEQKILNNASQEEINNLQDYRDTLYIKYAEQVIEQSKSGSKYERFFDSVLTDIKEVLNHEDGYLRLGEDPDFKADFLKKLSASLELVNQEKNVPISPESMNNMIKAVNNQAEKIKKVEKQVEVKHTKTGNAVLDGKYQQLNDTSKNQVDTYLSYLEQWRNEDNKAAKVRLRNGVDKARNSLSDEAQQYVREYNREKTNKMREEADKLTKETKSQETKVSSIDTEIKTLKVERETADDPEKVAKIDKRLKELQDKRKKYREGLQYETPKVDLRRKVTEGESVNSETAERLNYAKEYYHEVKSSEKSLQEAKRRSKGKTLRDRFTEMRDTYKSTGYRINDADVADLVLLMGDIDMKLAKNPNSKQLLNLRDEVEAFSATAVSLTSGRSLAMMKNIRRITTSEAMTQHMEQLAEELGVRLTPRQRQMISDLFMNNKGFIRLAPDKQQAKIDTLREQILSEWKTSLNTDGKNKIGQKLNAYRKWFMLWRVKRLVKDVTSNTLSSINYQINNITGTLIENVFEKTGQAKNKDAFKNTVKTVDEAYSTPELKAELKMKQKALSNNVFGNTDTSLEMFNDLNYSEQEAARNAILTGDTSNVNQNVKDYVKYQKTAAKTFNKQKSMLNNSIQTINDAKQEIEFLDPTDESYSNDKALLNKRIDAEKAKITTEGYNYLYNEIRNLEENGQIIRSLKGEAKLEAINDEKEQLENDIAMGNMLYNTISDQIVEERRRLNNQLNKNKDIDRSKLSELESRLTTADKYLTKLTEYKKSQEALIPQEYRAHSLKFSRNAWDISKVAANNIREQMIGTKYDDAIKQLKGAFGIDEITHNFTAIITDPTLTAAQKWEKLNNEKLKGKRHYAELTVAERKGFEKISDSIQVAYNLHTIIMESGDFATENPAFKRAYTRILSASPQFNNKINAIKNSDNYKNYAKTINEDNSLTNREKSYKLSEYVFDVFYKENTDLCNAASDMAFKEAEEVVLHDFNATASIINDIRFQASKKGQGYSKIINTIDAIVPFVKTNINAGKRTLEFSPIGLIRTMTKGSIDLKKGKINQNEYISNLSKGLTGTGQVAVGLLVASLGMVAWDDDDLSYVLKLGEKTYSLDATLPASSGIMFGVDLYDTVKVMQDDEATIDEKTFSILDTTLIHPLTASSLMSTLADVLYDARYSDGSSEAIGKVLSGITADYVTSFTPAWLKDVARIIDPYKRTVYTEEAKDNIFIAMYNKLLYNTPIVSTWLPAKQDIYGNDIVDLNNPMVRIFNQVINPFAPTTSTSIETNRIYKEMDSLYQVTGNSYLIPKTPQSTFSNNDIDYDMTSQEKYKYQKSYGSIIYSKTSKLVNSSYYKNMSNEQKSAAIQKIYDYARIESQKAIVEGRGKEYVVSDSYNWYNIANENNIDVVDMAVYKAKTSGYEETADRRVAAVSAIRDFEGTNAQKAALYTSTFSNEKETVDVAVNAGMPMDNYLDFKARSTGLKADKDANGNTISGSLKRKVLTEIAKTPGLSREQKYVLALIKGYGRVDYDFSGVSEYELRNTAARYIVSLDISKDDKVALLKKAGFTVQSNGNITWK